MKLTKEAVIDQIETTWNELKEIYNDENERLESHPRHGVHEMLEVGEYAFPYFEDEFEVDMFIEDNKESLKAECEYDRDIRYIEWSSKSGVSVFVEGTDFYHDEDDVFGSIKYEFGIELDYSDLEEEDYGDLCKIKNQLKYYLESAQKDVVEFEEKLEKIQAIFESVALGVRSGCFSNGEVIFSSTAA